MKKLSNEEQFELDSEIELNCIEQKLNLNYRENKYNFNLEDVRGYLSRNPRITELGISETQLSDEGASLLAKVFPTIKQLTLRLVRMSDKEMSSLLASNPATKLAFNLCEITDQQASYLAGKTSLAGLSIMESKFHMSGTGLDALTNNQQLNTFFLSSRPIQEAVLEVLKNKLFLPPINLEKSCEIGYRNGTLTSLNLDSNQIGDDGARLLKNNRTITNLSLTATGITEQGAMALASSNVITHLVLTGNKIGDTGAAAFKNNQSITELKLVNCGIGEQGAIDLAGNKTITSLELDSNRIGNRGAAAFKDNSFITELDLAYCDIGAQGAIDLAGNKTITSLRLNSNIIGNRGAAAFKDNPSITDLNLSDCGIEGKGVIALAKNGVIIRLDISGNAIRDGGAAAFRDNTSLIGLELIKCHITCLGAIELAKNKTIKNLNLGGNSIGDDGVSAFVDNSSLTKLSLSHTGITDKGVSALALNQSICRLLLCTDNSQRLWTASAVYFLWANQSLLNGLCGAFQDLGLNHLSHSHTRLLQRMGPRNRLFQEQYALKTRKKISKCLNNVNVLADLVYDYAKGEFPYQYDFFTSSEERKAVNDLCEKMPELRKRFDFRS